jgi:hypothetical protein
MMKRGMMNLDTRCGTIVVRLAAAAMHRQGVD